MLDMKVKVIFKEPFKDGAIFGTKLYRTDEVAVLTEEQYEQARNSGAVLDVIEQMIPNPKKSTVAADKENAGS